MAFNKIGFHTGPGGNPTGIGDYFRALDGAGIPAVVKSADNYGPCGELAGIAAQSGVEHVIVFRLSTAGQNAPDVPPERLEHFDIPDYTLSPAEAAAKHWQTTLGKLPPEFDRDRVWLEVINEVDKNRSDWLGHFAAEIGRRALDERYKVTLFGWSSGEPEPEHWETEGMLRYLRMCANRPRRLAVSLHEYSLTRDDIRDGFPHKLGRFQQLFAACDAHGLARPTVHITEWGWEDRRIPGSWQQAMADIHWAAALYAAHPQVKGAAIWYLGAGYDNIANRVQPLIARIAEYTTSTRFPDPEVVQPPLKKTKDKTKTEKKEDKPAPENKEAKKDTTIRRVIAGADLLDVRLQPQVTEANHIGSVFQGTELEVFEDAGEWLRVGVWVFGPLTESISGRRVRVNTPALNVRTAPSQEGNQPIGTVAGGTELELLNEEGEWLQVSGWVFEPATRPPAVPGPEVEGDDFRFTHWPTANLPGRREIVQAFGSNPGYYSRFGLPGHEGVDLRAAHGAEVRAVADGEVVKTGDERKPKREGGHNYGVRVYIRHDGGYTSAYAHLDRRAVEVGDQVRGGDIIGRADNTGNILEGNSHLHLTLYHDAAEPGGATYEGYPHKIVSPMPFLLALLSPRHSGKVDLLSYLRGDGRLYEVKNSWGSQERMQTQIEGDRFYHTKNQQWEELWADDQHVYRGTDTSPGNGRYYTLREGDRYGSKWARRFMSVGEQYRSNPTVTFYRKSDCRRTDEKGGIQESWIKLIAIHPQRTFRSGIRLNDVVEIGRLLSPNGEPAERYFYARGFGLVGWEGSIGTSWISEIHEPGARPDNEREVIPCLKRS